MVQKEHTSYQLMDDEASGITPIQRMISSCTGAIITSLIVTPLDVVKIRLQAQHRPMKPGTCFIYHNGLMDALCVCSYCNGAATRPWYQKNGVQFTGTMDAMVKIARSEGLPSLWSGLPPTLVMSIPATVIYFTGYDQLKYRLGYREGDPSTRYVPVFAGSFARVIAATAISPIEMIRTKMQSEQLSYGQLGRAVSQSVQQGGLQALLTGLIPTLLRDVPFSAMYWFGYEYLKSWQMRKRCASTAHFYETFLAGAISGSFAAIVTLPFDVVKTHRQIEIGEASVHHTRQSPTPIWRSLRSLYASNGLAALYAGLVPRVIKVAPACAVMVSTYEFGKSWFRAHNKLKEDS